MKSIIPALLIFLIPHSLFAQPASMWQRVYTLDDSIIEMNTQLVSYGGKDIGRVRFRWTFRQPETLNGDRGQKYKTQLEVIEFICADQRYRPYEVTYFDVAGIALRKDEMNPPPQWRHPTRVNPVMSTLFAAACQLINRKSSPPAEPAKVSDREKVAKFARAFSENLQRLMDFKPVLSRFFAPTYLDGYVRDNNTNWFLNLDRAAVENASHAELKRFYVAALNANYLTCLYLMSRSGMAHPASEAEIIPSDVLAFVAHHPYTAKYQRGQSNYDYIAEPIDTVERMRSYTSLLEGISGLMRKYVISVDAEHSSQYRKIVEEWDWERDLYQPKERICADYCFDLPPGTKIYEVNVPLLHLQIAEINNEWKILSAADYFH
jgi:hypothetical protein